MGWNGRQRLLKPEAGQAIIEIVPAILIFAMVISAGLRYFEVFRGAVESEQVARNLMMAKIGNSGTLTTPASQLANPVQSTPTDRNTAAIEMDLGDKKEKVIDNNVFIDPSVFCFSVFPPDWRKSYPMNQIFVYGGGKDFPDVQLTTYASVCRRAK